MDKPRKKSDEEILFSGAEINGFKIKPWSFGILFEISEELDKIIYKLNLIIDNKKAITNYTTLLKLLTLVSDDLLFIISKTINLSKDKIKSLKLIDGISIIIAIYKQNIDIINNKIKDINKIEESKKDKNHDDFSLTDILVTLLQNNVGKDINDLLYNYSTDQIYLLYEKCRKAEIQDYHMTAIILFNALIATSPSHKQEHVSRKTNAWSRFINSLDWNKIREIKKKPSIKDLARVFSSVGIPVKIIKKGD